MGLYLPGYIPEGTPLGRRAPWTRGPERARCVADISGHIFVPTFPVMSTVAAHVEPMAGQGAGGAEAPSG
jgi:hypothetical protein